MPPAARSASRLAAHGPGIASGVPGGYWPAVENTYITFWQSLQPGDRDYVSGVLLQPGNNPAVSPTNDANLPVSAEMISKGGFASLTLNNLKSGSYLTFADNTTVSLPGQLVINNIGTIIVPNGVVGTLQANYVQWNGALGQFSITSASNVTVGPGLQTFVISQPLPLAGLFGPGDTVTFTDNSNSANTMSGTVASYDAKTGALAVNVTSTTGSGNSGGWIVAPFGNGTLNIVANTVDLIGNLSVLGARTAAFNVAGDVRLTGTSSAQPAGSLLAYGNLSFAAGQIYPMTCTTFTLASALPVNGTISFTANGAPPQCLSGKILNRMNRL